MSNEVKSKSAFELLYEQLKFESKSLKEIEAQREKFVLAMKSNKILRKGFSEQIQSLKKRMKHAKGEEFKALSFARKQLVQNDYAVYDSTKDFKSRVIMMDLHLPSLRQKVIDLGRECRHLCPEGWSPEPKPKKAPKFDTVEERVAYIESLKEKTDAVEDGSK